VHTDEGDAIFDIDLFESEDKSVPTATWQPSSAAQHGLLDGKHFPAVMANRDTSLTKTYDSDGEFAQAVKAAPLAASEHN